MRLTAKTLPLKGQDPTPPLRVRLIPEQAGSAYCHFRSPQLEGKIIQGFAGFNVGDRVRVKLINVNVERGFIDFVGVS